MYALDALTGEQKWDFRAEGTIVSTATVVNGTVYFGSRDYSLYAVDAETGEQEWVFPTNWEIHSAPTVADGTVFIGSSDGSLYAVDAKTGEKEWRLEDLQSRYAHGRVRSSPTVVDGVVYVGSDKDYGGAIYAVDAGVDGSSEGSRVALGTLGHHDEWTGEMPEGHVDDDDATAVLSTDPDEPEVGETVTLDASESSSEAGDIVEYNWDLDGDGDIDLPDDDAVQTRSYDDAGDYEVAVTVVSSVDTTDTTTAIVSVEAASDDEEPSDSGDDSGDDDSAEAMDTDDDGSPGFGVGGALAALGGAWYVLHRRLAIGDDET